MGVTLGSNEEGHSGFLPRWPSFAYAHSMNVRERIDAFPTQLILTVLWATVGTTISFILKSSILWVSLISIYAICISHWTAHIAWKGKRIAEEIVEDQ